VIRRQHIHISLFRGRQRRRESNHQTLLLPPLAFLLIKTADSKKTGNSLGRLFCFSAAEKTRENRRSSGGYPQRVWAGRWNPSPFDDLNIFFFSSNPKRNGERKKRRRNSNITRSTNQLAAPSSYHFFVRGFLLLAFECLFLFF
jgi:hypothetical protein